MATRKRMAGPVGAREPELTLSEVFRRFVTDGKYHADGSLKTEAYLRHCEQSGKHLARYFGPDYPARLLTPDKLREYTVERREGRITGYPVRTNTIQRELGMLKATLNFACSVHDDDGQPLMPRNPMEKLKLPREKDPKRPVIDRQTAQALRDVADEVHPFLETIIVLAQTTGRRLSAILGLRWDDIDFEKNTIRWRAETDKMRKTWVIPIPKKAWKELQRFRLSQRAIGASLLFPHPRQDRHPGKPVTRHLAAYWLKRATSSPSSNSPTAVSGMCSAGSGRLSGSISRPRMWRRQVAGATSRR